MYSLLVLTSISWPLYFERLRLEVLDLRLVLLARLLGGFERRASLVEPGALAREGVLGLALLARDLGELDLDPLQVRLGVVQTDQLLEVWAHAQGVCGEGTVGARF